MSFTEAERRYLAGQMMGRLATVGPDGTPQVRPLGFRLNPDGTIDLEGPRLTASQRYRNVLPNPRVGFVVDDMTPDGPGAIKPGMAAAWRSGGMPKPSLSTIRPGIQSGLVTR